MSETQSKQDGQKTVVTFIAGLAIGGLLVWVFGSGNVSAPSLDVDTENEQVEESVPESSESEAETQDEEVSAVQTGDATVEVSNHEAGSVVAIASVTYPNDEGWIGVRDYNEGELGFVLGVARFSKEQNLSPESIVLQRDTVAGNRYAVVFYTESGDRSFDLREDFMVEDAMIIFEAK